MTIEDGMIVLLMTFYSVRQVCRHPKPFTFHANIIFIKRYKHLKYILMQEGRRFLQTHTTGIAALDLRAGMSSFF
jgi:hypothetical protein